MLTQSDLMDIGKLEASSKINETIIHILNDEKHESNVGLVTLKFETKIFIAQKNETLEKARDLFYKAVDNDFSKKTIALSMILKEKIDQKGKVVKNIIFIS